MCATGEEKACTYTELTRSQPVARPLIMSRSSALVDPPPPAVEAMCACFLVRSLSRKMSQLYDDTLAPSGLRGTQFSLLLQARPSRDGELPTVTHLAERLNTDRTTLTRNLRILSEAGLVALVPGKDARSKCVQITPEGTARLKQAKSLWRQAQQQVNALCGAEDVLALKRMAVTMLPLLGEKEAA